MENEHKKKFCTKCGKPLPEGSNFCSFCSDGSHNDTPSKEQECVRRDDTPKTSNYEENTLDFEEYQESERIVADLQNTARKKNTMIIISVVVILILVFLNVVQYAERDTLQSRIMTKEVTIASLDKKAEYYDTICEELNSGNIGYATDNFKSSENIILMSQNTISRNFILTAHWQNGGTVEMEYSGDSASLSFDNNSWNTTTPVSVVPNCEGVTVVTFKNNVDSNTFKVIIIVTE